MGPTDEVEHIEVEHISPVVVGGGQEGLAVGYQLARRRDRPFGILDAYERIGFAWRAGWDSLQLFTVARFNTLPGWPFPAPAWSFSSMNEMADYPDANFDLPVRSFLYSMTSSLIGGVARDAGHIAAHIASRQKHRRPDQQRRLQEVGTGP